MSNYATKSELKNTTDVYISDFAKKSEVDKLDIDKLKTTPIDLSKLSDVVKNEVIKTTVYDEFVKKS